MTAFHSSSIGWPHIATSGWVEPDWAPLPSRRSRRATQQRHSDVAAARAALRFAMTCFRMPGHGIEQEAAELYELLAKAIGSGPSVQIEPSAVTQYCQSLRHVPAAEAVFWKQEGQLTSVWTVLNEHDWEAEDAVYDVQSDILRRFRSDRLDFLIIYSHGATAASIQPVASQRCLAFYDGCANA